MNVLPVLEECTLLVNMGFLLKQNFLFLLFIGLSHGNEVFDDGKYTLSLPREKFSPFRNEAVLRRIARVLDLIFCKS